MPARPTIERLKLDLLMAHGRTIYIYYDSYYHGCINESGRHWRVWLHSRHLGDFSTADAARDAVISWYRGLDITPW